MNDLDDQTHDEPESQRNCPGRPVPSRADQKVFPITRQPVKRPVKEDTWNEQKWEQDDDAKGHLKYCPNASGPVLLTKTALGMFIFGHEPALWGSPTECAVKPR